MSNDGEERIGAVFGKGSGTASLSETTQQAGPLDGTNLLMLVFALAFVVPVLCCFPKFIRFVKFMIGESRADTFALRSIADARRPFHCEDPHVSYCVLLHRRVQRTHEKTLAANATADTWGSKRET
jgi:hypothetical protein